ncbi:hypothetical protein D3C75_709340 [compost metagenome]
MLQRFASILDTRRKSKGFGAILLFTLVLILSGVLVACGSNTDTGIPTKTDTGTSNTESSAPSPNNNELVPTDTPEITPVPSDGTNDHAVAPVDDTARDFLNSEDGQSLQTIARTFIEAYLSGNHEEMKKLLIDPEYELNEYPTENQMDNMESMTLKLSAASIREDMVLPSYELVYKDRDTYLYFTLEMQKTEDGWMIGAYYLEQ